MPPDDLSTHELHSRLRAQRIDFLARLLRAEGAFDTDLAEELADHLARTPDVRVYPDHEEVA